MADYDNMVDTNPNSNLYYGPDNTCKSETYEMIAPAPLVVLGDRNSNNQMVYFKPANLFQNKAGSLCPLDSIEIDATTFQYLDTDGNPLSAELASII